MTTDQALSTDMGETTLETTEYHQELSSRLPVELSTLLGCVCCVHDKTHHIVRTQSSQIMHVLETTDALPQQPPMRDKVPLPNDLFVALRSAIGYDATGTMLVNGVDHDALGMALSSIVLNARVFAELNGILTDVVKLSLSDLAKTDGGARAIFKLIEKKVITLDDKSSLETILSDLAKTNWGGYVIWEILEGNIFTIDNKETLMDIIPSLKTTHGGDHALCAMIERKICTMQEAGKSPNI